MVRDICPGANSAGIASLTEVNGIVYFRANDGINGYELWRSDGTSSGTIMVRDIQAGPTGSMPQNFVNFSGTLYLAAGDDYGMELWKSDGTSAGTVRIGDIMGGPGSSTPGQFTVVDSRLIFVADNGIVGRELWTVSDLRWITDTSPRLNDGPLNPGFSDLKLFFNRDVVGADLPSNYDLRAAGVDKVIGTSDDVTISLTATYSNKTATLVFPPLASDSYRLVVKDTITDVMGSALNGDEDDNPGGNYVRDFVANAPVSTFALTPNQVVHGQLSSRFSVDRWTFTGQVNQQIQLNVVAADAGVTFELKGPNGAVIFSNLASSSQLLSLPDTGSYVLTASARQSASGGRYSFRFDQAVETTLMLGMAYQGTFGEVDNLGSLNSTSHRAVHCWCSLMTVRAATLMKCTCGVGRHQLEELLISAPLRQLPIKTSRCLLQFQEHGTHWFTHVVLHNQAISRSWRAPICCS